MLQAVTAPPSSGQWFGFPRCCSLTGQGADPSHCTQKGRNKNKSYNHFRGEISLKHSECVFVKEINVLIYLKEKKTTPTTAQPPRSALAT